MYGNAITILLLCYVQRASIKAPSLFSLLSYLPVYAKRVEISLSAFPEIKKKGIFTLTKFLLPKSQMHPLNRRRHTLYLEAKNIMFLCVTESWIGVQSSN